MSGAMEIRFDPAAEKRFHEGLEKFYKDGPKTWGQALRRLRVTLTNQVRARSYSSPGPSSLGVGPGRKYGHVRDSLQGRASNIGWGGYIRINPWKPGGKGFVARFHEFGTGGGKNRSGNMRGKGLPARGPMAAGYQAINQAVIETELSAALDKVLK